MNGIVNNVAFHFAHSVFPLISIQTTKTLTFWKTLKKKEDIKSDLQELVASISPRYQSIAGGFFNQIAYLHENCEKISLALDKQGEDWHREIDNIVKELKSNISDIKCKQLTFFSVGCRNPRNNFRN